MQLVTPGLVLREVKVGEADRILTILTPEHGVLSCTAKGSLRLKSKLFSACGLFCYSEFTLAPGKNMYTVLDAENHHMFHGISSSIEGMSLAMYLAEMAAALSPTSQEAEKELRLLLNCLYMISEGKAQLKLIKAVFELRTMSECGYMPQLLCCTRCGAYDGPDFFLDIQEGYLLCRNCGAAEGKRPNLDPGALFALRHVCLVDDKRIFGFRISAESQETLAALAERYALTHLDKPLKSYDFLKSVLP